MKIAVDHFKDLKTFEDRINEVAVGGPFAGFDNIVSTHVGVDDDGWWAVLIYKTWEEDE